MRVGGRVAWLLEPQTPDELRAAWCAARERGHEPRILGGGANLIVQDGELPGVVIATSRLKRVFRPGRGAGAEEALDADAGALRTEATARRTDAIADDGDALRAQDRAERDGDPRLVAWCGASMPSIVRACTELGWSGFEGLVGVPGNIGGGVAMNAGGKWGEVWDVVEAVRVIEPDGAFADLARADCNPSYRDGGLAGRLVAGCVLRFRPDDPAAIRTRAREFLHEKKRAQPVTEWSAGCIFKNPDRERSEGRSAGKLIEDCGGKGLARGDAVVSALHANFIVNRGKASAADVLGLIEDVRELVLAKTGIRLEREVKVWAAEERAAGAP